MLLKPLFIAFLSLSSFSSVYPKEVVELSPSKSEYQLALENPTSPQSCKVFDKFAKDPQFSLQEVAQLRYAESCAKKPNWTQLEKNIKDKNLKPFITRYQFESLFKQKKYKEAYRIYNQNTKYIDLDSKDFDELANGALKTSLSKKEKNILRKKLYAKSPRFIPNPKKSDFLKVAKDYRSSRNFEKALLYYRRVINEKGFSYHEKWFAFKGARMTYKLERWSRMEKYIKASGQWADFLRDKYKWSNEMTRMHHEANIEYIRTLWTERGQKQALPPLHKLEKELKKRYSLQMIYWLKGRMAEENKDYQEAVRWLKAAANEKAITSEDEQRVLWSLAWNQRRIEKFEDSQQTLERLKKHRDVTFFAKTKYLYWQAENLYSMKKESDGKEALQDLADLDILGYYGSLALRRLGKAFPKPPKPTIERSEIFKFFPAQESDYLQSLVDIGELEFAENFVMQRMITNQKWETEDWVKYFVLLQEVGAYKNFFYRYHSLKPKMQVDILKDHSYLLFPQPFKHIVSTAANQSQVSPALIYSIMKQESGFDLKARSYADAFGLLQLIPQVAKKAAARRPDVGYKKPEDLYEPRVIISLGADTLRHLLEKFKNNFILSVASYNASEKAAQGWVHSRFHGDPVTFIEDIPYEETKGYVKLVMRNYIAYNLFETGGDNFTFPEVCLEGLQTFKK